MHKKSFLLVQLTASHTCSLKQQQCYLPNKLQVVTMAAVLNGTFFSIQSSLHPYTNDQLSNSLTLQLTVTVIEICSLKQTLKQMS